MPHLLLRIVQHPQAPDAERRDREHARQAAHERIREPELGALYANDAQADDDAAKRRAAPRPECDVIRQQQERVPAVAVAGEVEQVDGDRDENRVECKGRETIQKCGARVNRKIGGEMRLRRGRTSRRFRWLVSSTRVRSP